MSYSILHESKNDLPMSETLRALRQSKSKFCELKGEIFAMEQVLSAGPDRAITYIRTLIQQNRLPAAEVPFAELILCSNTDRAVAYIRILLQGRRLALIDTEEQIRKLTEERAKFLAEQAKAPTTQPGEETLDSATIKIIREQLKAKGYE